MNEYWRIAEIFGLEWEKARAWNLLVVACHDLGKACPGFRCKWENMTGMDSGRSPNTDINHAFVSQLALTELLHEMEWPEELAELVGFPARAGMNPPVGLAEKERSRRGGN
jgi:CRISPR-associated endonuclease/helicase Cas3